MPSLNIKTYYKDAASEEAEGRELLPAIQLPPLPSEHMPALERLIEWGKERKELTEIMRLAESGSESSGGAMHTLTQMFPVKNKIQRVYVPKELIDIYAGGNARDLKFGVQDINSDEQWNSLQTQVEEMKKYFPDIALYAMVDEKTGKKTALVMGIEAHAYNSVNRAQRKKEQLSMAVRHACQDLGVPEAWVDRKIEQTGNAQDKPKSKGPPPPPRKNSSRRPG